MKSEIRRRAEFLLDPSLNNTEVARLTGKHRDTIRKQRRRTNECKLDKEALCTLTDQQITEILEGPAVPRVSACVKPDWDRIVPIALKNGDNLQEIYDQVYLEQPLEVGQRHMSYQHFARQASPQLKRRAPEYRHFYQPGEIMQIDFAGYQPQFRAPGTGWIKATLLVATLPFSQYYQGEIIASQARTDTISGLINILERLGGQPKRMILDNFKAAIDRARGPNTPAKINQDFQAFLDHHGISPDPARRGEPRDKGSTECGVKLVQRALRLHLRHREPRSITELNEILHATLDRVNAKMMRRWKTSRKERFHAREARSLRPLPSTRYEYGSWSVGIKVPVHYHVVADGREYSVPYALIGKAVNVKITASTVEIFAESQMLAVHVRRPVTLTDDGPVTDSAHMPPNHRAMRLQTAEGIIEHANEIGEAVGAFAEMHLELHSNPRATFSMLKRLYGQISIYGKKGIDAACAEAIRRNQIDADCVRRILARRPNLVDRAEPHPPVPPSGNIRGAAYYAEGSDDAA